MESVTSITLSSVAAWLRDHRWPRVVVLTPEQYWALSGVTSAGHQDHRTGSIFVLGTEFIPSDEGRTDTIREPEDFPG